MASELRFHPRVKADPTAASLLTGPLKGIYSYHLHHRRNQYRIAYLYAASTDTATVLMIAKRENFYDLLARRMP